MTKKRTRTFGVQLPSLHEGVQSLVWPGIAEAAAEHGVRLITFVSTSQDQVGSLHEHYGIIHDFITRSRIDGCIIFAGAMAEHLPVPTVLEYCSKLNCMPFVSIALSVPHAACILVNNRAGIIENIAHLVHKHGRKRIAFIKGPDGHEEAEERFRAYREGLEANGLPVSDDLILPGQFSDDSGIHAVTALITGNVQFDAIVAADDETAFGAIKELKRRGIEIPGRIAVAGFDDVAGAATVLPSLTTVRQPLYKQGAVALRTLLDLCRNKKVKFSTHLPTESVYRRSCGCFPGVTLTLPDTPPVTEPDLLREKIAGLVYTAVARLRNDSGFGTRLPATRLKNDIKLLVHSLIEGVEKNRHDDLFLTTFDVLANSLATGRDENLLLHSILSAIASYIPHLFKKNTHLIRANQMLQSACIFMHDYMMRHSQSQSVVKEEQELMIREITQKLITTFDLDRLLRVIEEGFPRCAIRNCCIALYKGTHVPLEKDRWVFPATSSILLALRDGTRVPLRGERKNVFPTAELLPEAVFDREAVANCIVLPLFFEKEHFGFIVLEHDPSHQFYMYEDLRLHLSCAIKSSFLLEELKAQSARDELTNLYNRRGFFALSNQMVCEARKNKTALWIFYLDLDGLKGINDTWGHKEGDFAIAGAAQILNATFRKQDIIGRVGGDEFTVMLAADKKYSPEENILIRLQKNIEAFNDKSGKPYALSMSVGVRKFVELEDATLESLIKTADDEMIRRKRKKKCAVKA